jgi:hypothetical protein
MDDNNLLMIILAFVVGYMIQGMMKNMCGGRQVRYFEPSSKKGCERVGTDIIEKKIKNSEPCGISNHNSCQSGYCAFTEGRGLCAPMPDELIGRTYNDLWTSEYGK